jgi:GNAT superfamily N-acetyltransferase
MQRMSTANEIIVSTDKSKLDLDVIFHYLNGVAYWSLGRSREVIARTIENSMCFGLYDSGKQVGFARVVTDKATFAWLCDVFVLESHAGKGLGKKLIGEVAAHPDLQGLKRFVLATRDAHGLYLQYGFEELKNPEMWMAKT